MTAPLRMLIVGDLRYNSEYIFGIHQGAALLGHWATVLDIRSDLGAIRQKLADVQPHAAFMHMLMWSPMGPQHTAGLLQLCADVRRKYGTRVLIHDGDARPDTRYPHDISAAVDLALCNHTADRGAWKIPQLHWPYFAFVQRAMAEPVDEFRCDLFFAGRRGPGLYCERTRLLSGLKVTLGDRMKCFPTADVPHTLFRTPEVAASANAILGHGRPPETAPGWKDVRYWQYPGAGGVLIHDDLSGPLEPSVHFLPCIYMDAPSILEAVERAKIEGDKIRRSAFAYVQAHHSSTQRVATALRAVGL